MSPTLIKGDQFYTSELAYAGGAIPRRGDVIVFWGKGIPDMENEGYGEEVFVKRVVGLPGETLSVHAGQIWVNGKVALELAAFHYEPAGNYLSTDGDSFIVPTSSYFVLGDNTHNSKDSRYFGCVPASNVRGKVLFRFWPPGRIGVVP